MTANLRVTRQIVEVLESGDVDMRVTRQIVEALVNATPEVRATRQIVEVLSAIAEGSVLYALATDALSFSDVARIAANTLTPAAADTLTLTQNATVVRKRLVQSVADNLRFTQLATVVFEDFNPAVGDTLSFGEMVVCVHRNLNPKAADNLVLNDYATVATASRFPRVQDTLAFVEAAVGTTLPSMNFPVSARDALSFVQRATVIGPVVVSSQDALGSTQTQVLGVTGGTSGQVSDVSLGLVDVATVVVVRAPYAVTDRLSFGERAIGSVLHPGAKAGVAADTLTFVDAACRSQVPTSADALLFTDAATVAAAKAIHDALVLVDVATAIHVGGAGAIDALSLQESVAFVLVHGDPRWVYTPFVGTGAAGNPTPPGPLVGPTEGIGTCRFVYPTTSPTVTVPLRSPEFGNKDRLQFNRISRESRGGTLIVFADPMWPKVETQVLTFIGLSFTQSQALLSFIQAYLGLEVGFVDWEGRYWTGIITNTTDPVVQDGRGAMYTASLEFECQLATWVP